MKKVLIVFLILFFPICVKASEINSISMNITIDEKGDAHVIENWKGIFESNVEICRPLNNLGNSKIDNFELTENGKTYKIPHYWELTESNSNYKDKLEFKYIRYGSELCFHTSLNNILYKLEYDIENFVIGLKDSDMISFTLIPKTFYYLPKEISINIDFENKQEVLAYNYGNSSVKLDYSNKNIKLNTKETLKENEEIVLLAHFKKNSFQTKEIIDRKFKKIKKCADKGDFFYDRETLSEMLLELVYDIRYYLLIIFGFLLIKKFYRPDIKIKKKLPLAYDENTQFLPKNVPLCRDLPLGEDIFKVYWVACNYDLMRRKTDLFGAVLLKWLYEKKIEIKQNSKSKKKSSIILFDDISFSNKVEDDMYKILKMISIDNELEYGELKDWCYYCYKTFYDWFSDAYNYGSTILLEEGYLKQLEGKTKYSNIKVCVITEELKNAAIRLKGFKNYIKKYTLLHDKELVELNFWEYYLIYAQILGLSKKVIKKMKKIYPEFSDFYDFNIDEIDYVNRINDFTIVSSINSKKKHKFSKTINEVIENSSDVGINDFNGSHSSSGGGNNSFGSGRGGGGFR